MRLCVLERLPQTPSSLWIASDHGPLPSSDFSSLILLGLWLWASFSSWCPADCWHPPSLPGEGSSSVYASVSPHASLQLQWAHLLSQVTFCKDKLRYHHLSQMGQEWRAAPPPQGPHPAWPKPCQGSLGGSSEDQFALHWELFYGASSLLCTAIESWCPLSDTGGVGSCKSMLRSTGAYWDFPDLSRLKIPFPKGTTNPFKHLSYLKSLD